MVTSGRLTERLEVRLPESMAERLRREADRRDVAVARVVREAIDSYLRGDRDARLRAAEELFSVEAPVADWPDMEAEIRAARGGGPGRAGGGRPRAAPEDPCA